MGDGVLEVAVIVEDDAVGAGLAARVGGARAQDGELVPGAGVREVEALVVVVLVGVVITACYVLKKAVSANPAIDIY